ncbi:MAG: hypothetical protein MJ177_05250 [Clostridia bacterium]|nr:hypothetical protein [Clostridia bacterium]
MNRGIKAIIAVVVCIWIFFVGIEIGNFREMRLSSPAAEENPGEQTQTVPIQTSATQQTTTQPTTTKPATTQPATTQPTTTQPTTTQPTTTQPTTTQPTTTQPTVTVPVTVDEKLESAIEQSTDKLLQELSKAINDTKKYQGRFTAQYNQAGDISLTNCSVARVEDSVDSAVKNYIGNGTGFSYKFSGGTGVDAQGRRVTPKDVIPPRVGDKLFTVTNDAVSSIEVKKVSGGKQYKLAIVPETATLKNPPTYNYNCVGYLDFSGLNSLTSAELTYSGTVIEATVGSNGLLSGMSIYMPITVTGRGRMSGANFSAVFDGSIDEEWSFSY